MRFNMKPKRFEFIDNIIFCSNINSEYSLFITFGSVRKKVVNKLY